MEHSGPYIGFFMVHSVFLNYALFGGLFSSSKYALLLHSSIYPLTMIHWKTNNGNCYVTEIEQKLVKNTKYESWVIKYPLFTQRYVNLFGIHTEKETMDKLTKIVFTLSWGFTLFKLFSLFREETKSPFQLLLEQNLPLLQKFQLFPLLLPL